MLKILGSIIILSVGMYFSSGLIREQESKLKIAEALIDFIEHIRASIYTSRLPLSEIYSSYKNEFLDKCGFIFQLNKGGIENAVSTVEKNVSQRAKLALDDLGGRLGGINTECQIRMCEEAVKILRDEYTHQKELFAEKKKMYGALPILMAISIIIMIL